MKIITSADNQEIKEAKKLHDSKYRKETRLFFFEGIHLLEEYLKNKKLPKKVFISENALKIYSEKLKEAGLLSQTEESEIIRVIPQRLYDKITAENAPQGIFTVAEHSSVEVLSAEPCELLNALSSPAVILESMRDPGNVGTVIRTAVSLGVKVIFTEDCADIFNPKVIRASMGAVFADSIYTVLSAATLAAEAVKQGFDVHAAILDEKAKPFDQIDIQKKSLFIIGNEGSGIKAETILSCNKHVYIPMTGKTESLNAAIATAVIIWELSKKFGR